jgi:glycosyltransferase involved in cell wall biosynthesis
MAHALDSVLESAALLRERPDIAFLLIGSGASREALVQKAGEMKLDNVVFVERQPKSAMPDYWSLCDISLITLKNDPLFATVIPSKIFESMGMGLPIVLALPEGEAAELVRKSGSGVVVQPEDAVGLARVLRRLADDRDECSRLSGASARAARCFSRDQAALDMANALSRVVGSRQ